ncbi:MAG: hypothetical protein R3B97_01865 [Dehalococcoidia bacterium]|nr:hypothetical protein [Dehalococcoidia bacterium]MCB9485241.1 hypothetical protein [Thermoflexaceae bacterium]
MAGLIGTIKTALFGPQRPLRWVRGVFTSGAEQIDPQQSDVRHVVPPLGGHSGPPGADELSEGESTVHPRSDD